MSNKNPDKVLVPRWALEFILENALFQDEGPTGEGWPSEKMRKATEELEAALSKNGQRGTR